MWRRRIDSAPAPTIQRPIVGGTGPAVAAASQQGRFTLDMKVETVTRSVMMVMIKLEVTLANRSDRALRDVTIAGDLISASKTQPLDQQVASVDTQLNELREIERVGPHQTHCEHITVQMRCADIDVLYQGKVPMFVPLVRLRAECETAEPVARTFFLGMGAQGAKLHPIPLDGPPGNYQGITGRAVQAAA